LGSIIYVKQQGQRKKTWKKYEKCVCVCVCVCVIFDEQTS